MDNIQKKNEDTNESENDIEKVITLHHRINIIDKEITLNHYSTYFLIGSVLSFFIGFAYVFKNSWSTVILSILGLSFIIIGCTLLLLGVYIKIKIIEMRK